MGTFNKLLWGVFARLVNLCTPLKKNCWIFGADYGRTYREGSKYLFEYILHNHKEVQCFFITRDRQTYCELKDNNIPVLLNYSLKGLYYTSTAECVFTCQYIHDIIYTYKKKNRRFYYLLHGMPYKLAMNALSKEKRGVFQYRQNNILTKLRGLLADYFIVDYKMDDVEFISVTSDFLVDYAHLDFKNDTIVKVLGMPRNDALFDDNEMARQKWVSGINNKFIITYMPTHRAYGRGDVSPKPFENRPDIQKWMEANNIVLLVKQHPNMIPKINKNKDYPSIIDITELRIDPQVCIYHSDVLITDYSSVWIDYLLLQRPIIFYYYDNFEEEDAGVHYDIKPIRPGLFCYSEDELFELLKNIRNDYNNYRPDSSVVNKFHKYIDNKSCERYFKEINRKSYETII